MCVCEHVCLYVWVGEWGWGGVLGKESWFDA